MPELPEVEIVRQTLEPLVRNQTIIGVRIYWNKVIKMPSLMNFKRDLVSQKILQVKRKAKHLLFELNDFILISHLRMEGKYYYQRPEEFINWQHVLLVLELSSGFELRYYDTRKFGTFHLQTKSNYQLQPPLVNVGPEPFALVGDVSYLALKLKNRRRAIKTILLDQTIISGLGNIYVDEVLFASKINPEVSCQQLTKLDLQQILDNSCRILRAAIKWKGTTVATYSSSLGVTGEYQKFLKVHTRRGLPCYVCRTLIVKIKVNGRGTYFCSHCQPKR